MDLFLVKTWLKARLGVDTERGATMVEYVLILALIAILVIGVVAALGRQVSSKFSQASSGIAAADQPITCDSTLSRSKRKRPPGNRRPFRVVRYDRQPDLGAAEAVALDRTKRSRVATLSWRDSRVQPGRQCRRERPAMTSTRRPSGHTTMLIRYWSSTCSQPGFSDSTLL